ncbi:MAG: PilT/PilU family type 4a pilus ATPase [Gammaproteobacteria bacterium]|nr:PilT/PilU family type 4a pilus ATPase [Gammaproteobacteria bacterium]
MSDESGQPIEDITQHLIMMVKQKGSDMFLHVGAPITVKANKKFMRLKPVLVPGDVERIAYNFMSDERRKLFEKHRQVDFAISIPKLGRFRANLFKQRGEASMVIRYIDTNVPTMEQLNLPPVLGDFAMEKNGLVIVIGATGSGKSTTLAAMIDRRNSKSESHIITLEDPIEFVHDHKSSLVAQREIGTDCDSFEDGIIAAMREAPDVILLGEIRNQETMDYALKFANTGHLALSTLHANDAVSAMDRIIGFYPKEVQEQECARIAENLRGVVAQRLVPTVDGKMAAALEVMVNNPRITDLIKKREMGEIKGAIKGGSQYHMQTFDQALMSLYQQNRISMEQALRFADSKTDLKLSIKLAESSPDDDDAGLGGLSLVDHEEGN